MTPVGTISDVRTLGRLPDSVKLPDAVITPHLASAARELAGWVGDYSGADGDMLDALKEAEGCLCMAYLLPVLNTFYTQGLSTLQKEMGDMDFLFHSPNDLDRVIERWRDRARLAAGPYILADASSSSAGEIKWEAI